MAGIKVHFLQWKFTPYFMWMKTINTQTFWLKCTYFDPFFNSMNHSFLFAYKGWHQKLDSAKKGGAQTLLLIRILCVCDVCAALWRSRENLVATIKSVFLLLFLLLGMTSEEFGEIKWPLADMCIESRKFHNLRTCLFHVESQNLSSVVEKQIIWWMFGKLFLFR